MKFASFVLSALVLASPAAGSGLLRGDGHAAHVPSMVDLSDRQLQDWSCTAKLFAPNFAKEKVQPYVFTGRDADDPQPDELLLNIFVCDHTDISIVSTIRSVDCSAPASGQGVSVVDSPNNPADPYMCYDVLNNYENINCTGTEVSGDPVDKNLPATVSVDTAAVTGGSLYAPSTNDDEGVITFCVRNELVIGGVPDGLVYIDRQWEMLFDWNVREVTFAGLVTKLIHVFEMSFEWDGVGGLPNCPDICTNVPSVIPGNTTGGDAEYADPTNYACNQECLNTTHGVLYLLVEADAQEPEAQVTDYVDTMIAGTSTAGVTSIAGGEHFGTRSVGLGELYYVTATAPGPVNSRDRKFTLTLTPDVPSVVQFKSFSNMVLQGQDNGVDVAGIAQMLQSSFFDSCVDQNGCQKDVFLNTLFFDGSPVDSVRGSMSLILEQQRRRLSNSPIEGRSLQFGQVNEGAETVVFDVGIQRDEPASSSSSSSSSSGNPTSVKAALALLSILCVGLIGGMLFMGKKNGWFGASDNNNEVTITRPNLDSPYGIVVKSGGSATTSRSSSSGGAWEESDSEEEEEVVDFKKTRKSHKTSISYGNDDIYMEEFEPQTTAKKKKKKSTKSLNDSDTAVQKKKKKKKKSTPKIDLAEEEQED